MPKAYYIAYSTKIELKNTLFIKYPYIQIAKELDDDRDKIDFIQKRSYLNYINLGSITRYSNSTVFGAPKVKYTALSNRKRNSKTKQKGKSIQVLVAPFNISSILDTISTTNLNRVRDLPRLPGLVDLVPALYPREIGYIYLLDALVTYSKERTLIIIVPIAVNLDDSSPRVLRRIKYTFNKASQDYLALIKKCELDQTREDTNKLDYQRNTSSDIALIYSNTKSD